MKTMAKTLNSNKAIVGLNLVASIVTAVLQNNDGIVDDNGTTVSMRFKQLWLLESHDDAIAFVLAQPSHVVEQIRSALRQAELDPSDPEGDAEHNHGLEIEKLVIVMNRGQAALHKGDASPRANATINTRRKALGLDVSTACPATPAKGKRAAA